MFSIMCDLETVIVTSYGDTKSITSSDEFLYDLQGEDVFVKKEGEERVLYPRSIRSDPRSSRQCIDLLSAFVLAPESRPQKPVAQVSQNHDASSSLDLTEETSDQTQKHSLSFVRKIEVMIREDVGEIRKDLVVVNNVLLVLNRPQVITIGFPLFNRPIEQDFAQLFESLVSRIPFNDDLLTLKLYEIYLTAKNAADIARSLHRAPSLHKLHLSSQHNLHSGLCDLAENLHHLRHLSKLTLRHVNMGDQECLKLATSLENCDELRVLCLSENPLGHGITELAQRLRGLPRLTKLDLGDTQMGEKEVIALARSLQFVPQLKKLLLYSNPLGDGIIEVGNNLHWVTHLTLLNLSGTQMGEEKVIAVARSLKDVPQLECLFLTNNPLGHGITELVKHLPCVPRLIWLDLGHTQMGEEEVIAVTNALNCQPCLSGLNLSHNPLGRRVTELNPYLSSSRLTRKYLYLYGVRMTKKEVLELFTVAQGKSAFFSDYHHGGFRNRNYRLYTEAELQERGVTFDDE